MDRLLITMDDFILLIYKYNITPKYILDIGSKNGKDAIYLNNEFKYARVIAIEGCKKTFEKYKNQINIEYYNYVITNYIGTTLFYTKSDEGISSIKNRGNNYLGTVNEVQCITMKELCSKLDIKNIDVLKIDVEGCTYEVLSGFFNLLKYIKIMHIETEKYKFFENQYLHNDVCNLLKYQFKIVDFTEAEIINNQYQCDSVWVNNECLVN